MGVEYDDITNELLEQKTLEMTRDEAVEYYTDMGLPCAPIYHVDETVADPQVNARNMFIEMDHPKAGKIKLITFPVKFSETPAQMKTPAPLLGEHNSEVLKEVLDYSDERIKELISKGVISYPE
jgi:CoA:oxalate CoA-transferase